jgi:hypothetical protein
MLISPPGGWQHFEHKQQLLRLIDNQLKLKEKGGIWHCYHFSERSQVWCSDEVSATNQLQITFESNQSGAMIRSLGIEMTNNSSEFFIQLFRLRKALKTKFAIRDDI